MCFFVFKLNTKNRFGLNLKQDVEKKVRERKKKGGACARATNKLSKKRVLKEVEKNHDN